MVLSYSVAYGFSLAACVCRPYLCEEHQLPISPENLWTLFFVAHSALGISLSLYLSHSLSLPLAGSLSSTVIRSDVSRMSCQWLTYDFIQTNFNESHFLFWHVSASASLRCIHLFNKKRHFVCLASFSLHSEPNKSPLVFFCFSAFLIFFAFESVVRAPRLSVAFGGR